MIEYVAAGSECLKKKAAFALWDDKRLWLRLILQLLKFEPKEREAFEPVELQIF